MPTFVICIIIALFVIGMIIAVIKNSKKAVFIISLAFCVSSIICVPLWDFTSPDSLHVKAKFNEELITYIKEIDWNDKELLLSNNFSDSSPNKYSYYSNMEYAFIRDADLSIEVYQDNGDLSFANSKDDVLYDYSYSILNKKGQQQIKSYYYFKVDDIIIEAVESYDIRMEKDVLKRFLLKMRNV
mgnify:CR=1 FL=1